MMLLHIAVQWPTVVIWCRLTEGTLSAGVKEPKGSLDDEGRANVNAKNKSVTMTGGKKGGAKGKGKVKLRKGEY